MLKRTAERNMGTKPKRTEDCRSKWEKKQNTRQNTKLDEDTKDLMKRRTKRVNNGERGTVEYIDINKLIKRKTKVQNKELIHETKDGNKSLQVLKGKLNNYTKEINHIRTINRKITQNKN